MVFRSSLQGYPIQQLRDEVDRLVTNVFNSPAVAGATRLVSGVDFHQSTFGKAVIMFSLKRKCLD